MKPFETRYLDRRRPTSKLNRIRSEFAGFPSYTGRNRLASTDVAGGAIALPLSGGLSRSVESASRILSDFKEFLLGDQGVGQRTQTEADPAFRERLRRQAWRTHVLTNLRDNGETH